MPTAGATLLEQLDAAVNRHDVEGVMALMAEDCLFENTFPPPDGSRYTGQEEVRQFWTGFFRASPNARFETEDAFMCDDRGVVRWLYRWVDADGTTGHVRGVDIFRFRDGKIAEKRSYVKG